MPKVSVVIITYNRAELLGAAIKSVLNQTYQDFEIIIVDDASPDSTADAVSGIGDPRIKYIRHETNRGEARSRNTGVINAAGEFIAFLDDDDEWLPTKLEKQVGLLQQSPPIVGGVYTGFIRVDLATSNILGLRTPSKRGDIYHEMATYNWVGTPSTVLLKRQCFDKVGLFDEGIVYGPDNDMWIRISKEFHFDFVPESLVKYYEHKVKLSFNYETMIKGKEAQLAKHAELFASCRKSYSRRYLDLGVYYCYSGKLSKGREAFIRAMRIYPFDLGHYFNAFLSFLGCRNFRRIKHLQELVHLSVAHPESRK